MNCLFSSLFFALLTTSVFCLPLETTQIRERRQIGLYQQTYGTSFQPIPYGVVTYQRMVPALPAYQPMAPVAYGPSLYSPMPMNSGFNPGYGSSFGYPQMSNPAYMMGFRARNRH